MTTGDFNQVQGKEIQMSASDNATTDEAAIRDLVEDWGESGSQQESRCDSGQSLAGYVDVRCPTADSIEGY